MYKNILILVVQLLLATNISAADIKAGKDKSVMCSACHGANGIGTTPNYPNLAGQKSKYLESQLKGFRDGKRQSPLMQPFVKDLSDEDIENLAAYFSSL